MAKRLRFKNGFRILGGKMPEIINRDTFVKGTKRPKKEVAKRDQLEKKKTVKKKKGK
jgi:hypothetical protein